MKRLLSIVLLCVGNVLAQQPTQPTRAPVADRNAFLFTRYDLNVSLNGQNRSLQARGTVNVTNASEHPQTVIALQLSSSLNWSSIRLNGAPLAFTQTTVASDIDHTGAVHEAVATLPSQVQPNAALRLEVAYQGTIPLSAARLQRVGAPTDVAQHSDWDVLGQTYTAFRGFGYVVWYPVALDPALLGDGNELFRAMGEFKSRNLGILHVHLSATGIGDEGRRMMLHSGNGPRTLAATGTDIDFPLSASVVPLIAVGNYAIQSVASADVASLTTAAAAPLYADVSANTSRFISDLLGAPKSKIQVIQNPDAKGASFESGVTLSTPMNVADSREIAFQLAHSLAHAAVPSWRPWVYEGIAHFAQARILEQQGGRSAALAFLEDRRAALAISDPDQPASATAQSVVNASDEIFYRTKAMFVWWMLRDIVGDQAFTRAVQSYREQDDKDASYVQRLFEKESNRKLENFFDDWVYRDRGLPDFKVISVYPRPNLKGSYLVTVEVENTGNAGAEVPIRIHTKAGDVAARLEVPGKQKTSARIQTNALPEEVVVNDGSVPESDISNNTYTVPPPQPK